MYKCIKKCFSTTSNDTNLNQCSVYPQSKSKDDDKKWIRENEQWWQCYFWETACFCCPCQHAGERKNILFKIHCTSEVQGQ